MTRSFTFVISNMGNSVSVRPERSPRVDSSSTTATLQVRVAHSWRPHHICGIQPRILTFYCCVP